MTEKKTPLEEVKIAIRGLVCSGMKGAPMTTRKLLNDYREMIGIDLPLLGFRSHRELLESLTDTIKLHGNWPHQTIQLVSSQNSSHIEQLILGQNTSSKSRSGRNPRPILHSSRKPIPQRPLPSPITRPPISNRLPLNNGYNYSNTSNTQCRPLMGISSAAPAMRPPDLGNVANGTESRYNDTRRFEPAARNCDSAFRPNQHNEPSSNTTDSYANLGAIPKQTTPPTDSKSRLISNESVMRMRRYMTDTQPPHGTTSTPHETSSPPHETTSTPHETSSPPHETTSQPHETASLPPRPPETLQPITHNNGTTSPPHEAFSLPPSSSERLRRVMQNIGTTLPPHETSSPPPRPLNRIERIMQNKAVTSTPRPLAIAHADDDILTSMNSLNMSSNSSFLYKTVSDVSETPSEDPEDQQYIDSSLKVPTIVQKRLITMAKKFPDGFWLAKLCHLYREEYNHELKITDYGHRDFFIFVTTLPKIFRYVRPNHGDWKLFFAGFAINEEEERLRRLEEQPTVPSNIKQNIFRLVTGKSYKGAKGVFIDEVEKLYQETFGLRVPLHSSDFKTVEDLVKSLHPNIVQLHIQEGRIFVAPAEATRTHTKPPIFAVTSRFDQSLNKFFRATPNMVLPSEDVAPFNFGTDFQVGNEICVVAGEIFSPSKFFLHRRSDYTDQLTKLMEEIQEFFEAHGEEPDNMYPRPAALPDVICAAKYESYGYHRIRVRKGRSDTNVYGYYFDYGSEWLLKKSSLRKLPRKFMKLPAQACAARLADVRPIGAEWSRDAIQVFHDALLLRDLVAQIDQIDEKNIVTVTMHGLTDGMEVVNIARLLVEKGHAVVVPEGEKHQPVLGPRLSKSSVSVFDSEENASECALFKMEDITPLTLPVVDDDVPKEYQAEQHSAIVKTEDYPSAIVKTEDYPSAIVKTEDHPSAIVKTEDHQPQNIDKTDESHLLPISMELDTSCDSLPSSANSEAPIDALVMARAAPVMSRALGPPPGFAKLPPQQSFVQESPQFLAQSQAAGLINYSILSAAMQWPFPIPGYPPYTAQFVSTNNSPYYPQYQTTYQYPPYKPMYPVPNYPPPPPGMPMRPAQPPVIPAPAAGSSASPSPPTSLSPPPPPPPSRQNNNLILNVDVRGVTFHVVQHANIRYIIVEEIVSCSYLVPDICDVFSENFPTDFYKPTPEDAPELHRQLQNCNLNGVRRNEDGRLKFSLIPLQDFIILAIKLKNADKEFAYELVKELAKHT